MLTPRPRFLSGAQSEFSPPLPRTVHQTKIPPLREFYLVPPLFTLQAQPPSRCSDIYPGSVPSPAPYSPPPPSALPGSTPPAPEAPPLTVAAPQAVCPLWLRGAGFCRELPARVVPPSTPALKAGSPQLEPRALLPSGSPGPGLADRCPLLSSEVAFSELLLLSL